MKFIHFADSHLDGFRDKQLSLLGLNSFKFIIDSAIKENVDFVLMAGDLFNTAIPRIDTLKFVSQELKRLKKHNIPLYAIAGSHDFSSQGRSILDVLEIADLLTLVMKGKIIDNKLNLEWIKDEKTGALISGIIGKKGMLDKKIYEELNTELLQKESGFKIFMFHTALEELKTPELKNMPGHPLDMLPKNCDYYAGGHVHIVKRYDDKNYKNIIYPGPSFPNSFSELEKLKQGTFVIYDSSKEQPINFIKIPSKEVISIKIDATNKTPEIITSELISSIKDFDNKIILLRIEGKISKGNIQDIDFDEFIKLSYDEGAFIILKNTSKLSSKSFEEIGDVSFEDSENIEIETIKEHLGQISFNGNEKEKILELINSLNIQQMDGEKKTVFNERVNSKAEEVLEK
jgi:DNA repair exonuclease SbcCD nuclease subunit